MIDMVSLKRTVLERMLRTSGEEADDKFWRAVQATISDLNRETVLIVENIDYNAPPSELDVPPYCEQLFILGALKWMAQTHGQARKPEVNYAMQYAAELANVQSRAIIDADVAVGLDYDNNSGP